MSGRLLKISEASRRTGLSASTLRRMCDSQRLPCVRPTGSSHRWIPEWGLAKILKTPSQSVTVVVPTITMFSSTDNTIAEVKESLRLRRLKS